MTNYQFILLDWDGCLAKTLDIHLQAYKETFLEFGINPTDQQITQEVFGDWSGPTKLGVQDLETFTEKYLARVNKDYPTVELYPHVFETIQSLKEQGKKLALVTTSLLSTVEPALKYNNLYQVFDVILSAQDVTNHKPDPEIIHLAIEKLHGIKDQTIIVGDSKSDLGAAQNAGIDSILFFPEHNEKFYNLETLKTYHPTYIIPEFSEVLNIINA